MTTPAMTRKDPTWLPLNHNRGVRTPAEGSGPQQRGQDPSRGVRTTAEGSGLQQRGQDPSRGVRTPAEGSGPQQRGQDPSRGVRTPAEGSGPQQRGQDPSSSRSRATVLEWSCTSTLLHWEELWRHRPEVHLLLSLTFKPDDGTVKYKEKKEDVDLSVCKQQHKQQQQQHKQQQ
ncbi:uncharacterized protein V6R79_023028 [Siganus canaliculatus]